MIVIEGPDLAGKSTLAAALEQHITREMRTRHPLVRHLRRPEQHFDPYWGYDQLISRDVIMDRLHLSHVLYRHVGNESHKVDPVRYSMLDAAITRVGGVVVLLAPDPDVIAERYDRLVAQGRQELYPREHTLRVADAYNKLAVTGCVDTATGTYHPKLDLVFVEPCPVADIVDVVTTNWLLRQLVLDVVAAARPGSI